MASSSGVQNYLNTIIFCVVAKAVGILVLGLILFPAVRPYATFFLTIELCLVIIIMWSIYKISKYDKRMAQEAEDIKNSAMTTVLCPDYYVREPNADMTGSICKNGYTTPDKRLTYRFLDDSKTAQIDAIDIDTMFQKKTIDEACAMLSGGGAASGSNVEGVAQFSAWPIPWTELRSKCSDTQVF